MQSNKLGCLTSTGIVAALITAFVLVGVAFASGSQMFTAGSLNGVNEHGKTYGGVSSHAQITDCKSCHTAPWERETMADRCASCHTEIAAEMFDVAKLHGIITRKSPSLRCRDCHPEHRGPTAALTDLGENVFPHEALGFSLNGHQRKSTREPFTCQDCHDGDVTTFASSTCDSCHRQMDTAFADGHVQAFGTDCLACHDGVDRFGNDFSHSAFTFKLAGKHKDAACTDCHINAHDLASLQSAPQDCFSCHSKDDAHQARFGQDCGSCHSSEGWKPAKFDHNLAAFKLEGRHLEAKCDECHINGVYKGTPMDCYSCHARDDEHGGQFGTDCGACHNASGWDSVSVDHNQFAFKLEGKHSEVNCKACHQTAAFKDTPTDCYSCHQKDDEHNGQFGTDCGACHTPRAWGEATFDHNRAAFQLTGAHVSAPCTQCHVNNVFKGTPTDCVSCHADPAYHAGMFGTTCAECHTTNNWAAAYNGPHPAIADEGGRGVNHGNTTCRTCHTTNLSSATCTACHDGNPGSEGGGEGGGHGGGGGDD